jgi:hypothetical protein
MPDPIRHPVVTPVKTGGWLQSITGSGAGHDP